jgi:nicotinate-nucleotide--dimethylbenzimidazole phosphoribosyltransferase
MGLLEDTLARITAVDATLEPAVRAHLDDLTKPRGSLGTLEGLAAAYCLATGTATPTMGKKRICTLAGDHGVAAEGVSAYPKEVTRQMVMNMLAGGAAVNVLAKHVDADLRVVDMGVAADLPAEGGLVDRKVRPGTDNMAAGPAMSLEEATRAVEAGIALTDEAHADGVTLLGTGDMGIANTTPSSALFAALLPCEVADITGRGTGIDDAALEHKAEVIAKALEVNESALSEPLSALAAVGGLEIAGIAGLALGGAAEKMLVVVDGFISSAGALVACRMKAEVAGYLVFSHMSAEAGHRTFFEAFGAKPLLDLGMRLGEGTGAALAMSLVEAAVSLYNGMATFSSAGVSDKD